MALTSFIIATYNRAHWLKLTIENILQQRARDWELLIVDDGSTDNTAQTVANFSDTRIRYFYREHGERCAARNFGLTQARGEFVIFTDDDDFLHPDMLARTQEVHSKTSAGLIYMGSQIIDEAGQILRQAPFVPTIRGNMLRELLVDNFGLQAALIERAWVERVGCFDTALSAAEDWDLWIRMAAAGCTFAFVPDVMFYYRMHADNTIRDWSRMENSSRFVLQRALDAYPTETAPYREIALARQSFREALRRAFYRDIETAQQKLSDAFCTDVTLTDNLDIFYQVVCATQPNGYKGTLEYLDIPYGAQFLLGALERTFARAASNTTDNARSAAFALAHETIARLYYAKRDLKLARQHFWRALQYQPSRTLRREFAATMFKANLPDALFSQTKRTAPPPTA